MLYKVGDKTEPCGTPACISLAVDISPSNKTLNFRCERNELMSLIKLVGNSSSDNLYSKPGCHVISSQSQSYFMTDDQSVSKSWFQGP
jgi:hypothetical protein